MRRVVFPMLLVLLLLAACGGTAFDPATVVPPNSKPIEATDNPKIDGVLSSWKNSVPQAFEDRGIKADSIKQNAYLTTDSLDQIQTHYVNRFKDKDGWVASTRTPGLDAAQGVLIDGYDHGTSSLIVGAIDAAKYGGQGVIVYTATGDK